MSSNKTFNKKFYPSKKMGQNFLIDKNIINNICSNIPDLSLYDCVIEIGPGRGAITENLLQLSNKLICIELDKRLFADLVVKYKDKKNVQIINDDFLQIDLQKLCKPFKRIIIVANIPYSITNPIVLKSLACDKIKTLYIMVQKEVADKWIYSKTSNRNASTNIINYYFHVEKVLDINKRAFNPIPKVDSAMILLDKKSNEKYDEEFYEFIKPFFHAKRKKILNNLPPKISRFEFISCLKTNNFDPNIRAEELDYFDWLKIYKYFKK